MKIPASPEDLDAAWLTAALRQGGALQKAAVASFEIRPLADGEGFMGQLLRVRPVYDREEPDAPASLVVKLSSQTPEMRQRVATRLAYQREVRFYQRLADQASLPTPRCYYAEVDGETGLHVLLLEDLAPGRSGSTVAGCSSEQAELAVHEIAHFHAAWWETPELERLDWLIDPDFDPVALREAHDRWWPDFLDQAGHRLPDPARAIGARLGEHRAHVMRHLTRTPPRTLVDKSSSVNTSSHFVSFTRNCTPRRISLFVVSIWIALRKEKIENRLIKPVLESHSHSLEFFHFFL